jgi:ribbon-helix-helix protein
MAAEIHRLRDRAGETEKITINLGYVDLGHIDLLVQEGFYTSFGRRSVTSFRPIVRKSGNRLCGIRWSLVSGTTRGRIWKP